jgi:hypothetical protein
MVRMNLMMQDIPADQSLIDYPSPFPIKVMGANVDGSPTPSSRSRSASTRCSIRRRRAVSARPATTAARR